MNWYSVLEFFYYRSIDKDSAAKLTGTESKKLQHAAVASSIGLKSIRFLLTGGFHHTLLIHNQVLVCISVSLVRNNCEEFRNLLLRSCLWFSIAVSLEKLLELCSKYCSGVFRVIYPLSE